ncbi:MAG: FkbM family methyltransferase [Planctomycetaceae bacterium]|nr:FkbM family methyltransferase [Planctomycetaceae bacterium]MBV8381997.1 FkbM family methyltransferase [Planctomycetaceae bacterium]
MGNDAERRKVMHAKSWAKWTLARLGFFLGRLPKTNTIDTHLIHLFSLLGIDCVLDVGAHRGEYGRELRRLGFGGRIISFEPIPENFALLRRECAGDSNWRAQQIALGSEEGCAEINVLSGTTFSSFLGPSEYGVAQFGTKMRTERTELVEVRRLEGLFDECVAGIERPRVFLKMDTQGYDLAVLEGAGTKLDRVAALQTELAVKPLYRGMTTSFVDSISRLQQFGFELTGLFPETYDPSDRLRVVELNCVMCRATGRYSDSHIYKFN